MEETLLQWITSTYGCAASFDTYRRIRQWSDWWRGRVDGFHAYLENAAFGRPVQRQMYGLHMAKKICEDWAALLLNDKTWIALSDASAQGWLERVLRDTDFFRRSNYLIERAFAAGTGACLLRVSGLRASDWIPDLPQNAPGDTASVSPDSFGSGGVHGESPSGSPVRFWFDFVDAGSIVPISCESGCITEAAFVSRVTLRGHDYDYVEVHIREADGYVIHNRYFDREAGKLQEVTLDGMPPREIRTGCPHPFFAILTPNIQNTDTSAGGLGQSIYGDAIDCLRGVDLAFNNFCRDLRLGGKKVFIHQSLVRRDDAGNFYTPDDVAQQLFMTVGDGDLSDNPMIEEHNPSLRTDENRDAVQAQLDYLSFRCGLGTRHYLFSGSVARTQMTATQYMGEKQDLRQHVAKHAQNVTAYLNAVVRPILWVASHLLGLPFAPGEITVFHDDSFFVDTETERARDLREVEAGLMTRTEFRKRWYGIPELPEPAADPAFSETSKTGGESE